MRRLYGTAFLQTYIYITNYPHDRRWIKAVVGIVWCGLCLPPEGGCSLMVGSSLETLHTICTWAYLYHLTVSNFGKAVALNDLPWYVGLTIPSQTFAGSIVQACRSIFCTYKPARRAETDAVIGVLLVSRARLDRQVVVGGSSIRRAAPSCCARCCGVSLYLARQGAQRVPRGARPCRRRVLGLLCGREAHKLTFSCF
jgi:hypothetical protein